MSGSRLAALARTAYRGTSTEERKVTFLELFFDLVFVFAITQLSHLVVDDLTWAGAGKAGFLLLVVWWAWMYTTWMTNWFDPDTVPVRAVLLVCMLASILMAAAVPEAFGDRGLLFACSYVALQGIRNAFNVVASPADESLRPSFVRLFAWNAWVGAVWIAGGLATGDARVAIWIAALLADYAGPLAGYWTPGLGRSSTADWQIDHSHFAERVQLFIIIALGESIVVTGATASGLEVTAGRGLAVVVAFVGSAALWWLYFDHVAEHAKEDFGAAADRGRVARDAYTYLHIPIVAGVIGVAVADELVIAHPADGLATAGLVAAAGGPLLYLLGHELFRLRLGRGISGQRVAAAGAVVGVAVAGSALSAVATGALIAAVLCFVAGAETVHRVREHA